MSRSEEPDVAAAAGRVDAELTCADARGAADAAVAAMVRLTGLIAEAARWTAEDRRGLLHTLDRVVDGFAVVRAAVLAAERDAGTWQGAGDRSFEAWRARTARAAGRSAAAQVRQAEHLGAVPSAAAAVTTGEITLDHATTIAAVASSGSPAQRSAARCEEGQEQLLDMARRLDAGTFAGAVARWAASQDPEALEADHEAQRRERFLTVTESSRGAFLKGRLDSMAGRRVVLALEALCPRPGADDERDPGQRRADALDAMAGRILAQADTKPGGHVPPQISMIVTAETWAGARAELARRRAAREGRSCPAGADTAAEVTAGYAPATLEDGTPVPVSELAAAMCDCEITRIVVDADGVPLDLGRTQRLFTREQRRAVIARDRECAWPRCPAHARWCEVHHIDWWDRDTGPTSVTNGVLLCSYHHHEVHRRDLTIRRLVGGGVDLGPPGHGGGPPGERAAAAPHADASQADRAGPTRSRGRPQRAPAPLSAVAYEFTERAGRVLAGGSGEDPGALGGLVSPRLAAPAEPEQRAPEESADGGGPDELDLSWATDPVTGMRVRRFLVGSS